MATVQEYLNWYRHSDNADKQDDGSGWFSEYIVSACWRKMERRIGHWAAVGLIYNLSTITDASISTFIEGVPDDTTDRPDFKLSFYLQT